MESTLPRVRRHFLSWDEPLLPQAVSWLAADWKGNEPLDLSTTRVLVPTRQAGRRLREGLAAHAAKHGQAVFPPQVQLPEGLFDAGPDESRHMATRLEARLAWAEVLLHMPIEDLRAVFPVDPPERNAAWALRTAREFQHLQRNLAESGMRLASVVQRAGPDFSEAERWRQIGELERRHAEALARRGLKDPQERWLEARPAPSSLAGVARIVLLGLPDPVPAAVAALKGSTFTCPIDVVVFAPENEAGAFDEWGRPREAAWTQRILSLADFSRRVHLCADPMAQAARMAELASDSAADEGVLALGAADPEVLPLLEHELERAGRTVFNPEGRRRAGDRLHQLLSALAELAADESFAAVAVLARCPDLLDYLSTRLGPAFSAARFLAQLDELHARHLPPTLTEARRHRPDDPALAVLSDMRSVLHAESFFQAAARVPGELFAARRFDLANEDDARAAEAAAAWVDIVRDCARAAEGFGSLSFANRDWWELALGLYGETLWYDEKPADAIELQGWLELLWEDAPHLVIAGFNDGRVPEAITGDPFLPESLRRRLGLKTNEVRFARDAYLLQALAQSRAGNGRLDLLFGKVSTAGDPLRPSRLLLRCADAELPERVAWLFRPAEVEGATPSWRRAWPLTPRIETPPTRVAVTALRAWLACPFRFYLRHGLRMGAVDAAKTELDAMDFGTLCHAALESMGRDPALRDCTDPSVIRDFLLEALDRETAARFGHELALPLVVQVESARQRLSRAAEVQARTRAEGWVTERVEEKFTLDLGGLVVSGKIDRVDRHEHSGLYRVIDYKTSDRPATPAQAHLRGRRRDDQTRDFARLHLDGREQMWVDLQLPLYLRAVAGMGIAGAAECAYFNLPKAAGDTGIRLWMDYTAALDEAAWHCAQGVAAAILAGEFWPPGAGIREELDEFAACFHHGAADSIAWPAAGGVDA